VAQQNLGRKEAKLREIGERIREMEWRSNRVDVEYPLRGFKFIGLQERLAKEEEN
jgi:hypothetical protein